MIRSKKLPTEAAVPQLTKRALKTLGSVDVDAQRLEAQSTFNTALLLPKAEVERARREAAGISDSVEVRQQEHAPPFDVNLVGKQLEICWPFKLNGKTAKIWSSGRVKRVADRLTDTKSGRSRRCCRPAPCCGRGRRMRTTTSRRVKNGSSCCPTSGTSTCTTAGVTTLASWGYRASLARRRARLSSIQWIHGSRMKSMTHVTILSSFMNIYSSCAHV